MWKRTLSSAGRSEEGGGGIMTSARSSPRRSCRASSCARAWSSCSCWAGAAITGTAERERRGTMRSKEGRLSVFKWSHHLFRTFIVFYRTCLSVKIEFYTKHHISIFFGICGYIRKYTLMII